uniref:PB1-like domain-containing protein n=1 Tax=Nicotiana tabacum TaxID=4097 RepID=A0A1S4B930_TOBAC|nr:PREDICTED: uncharacterized protein LOC107805815 [Nicotiana tabacum]
MYIKRNGAIESRPSYGDLPTSSVIEASCFSIKVYHGGLMKQQSTKHYVGAVVDYFDYVKPTDINMTELRKMAEICGYVNDSVIFWHKCGKFGNILRLLSTEVEIEPENEGQTINIQNMQQTIGITEKMAETSNSSSCDEFEDSENEISDFNPMLDKRVTGKQPVEGGRELISAEVQKKLSNEEGDSDCVNSSDTLSLDNGSFDFPKYNPKTDEKSPILALEYTFGNKNESKFAVETHEIKAGKYIKWRKNDKIRIRGTKGFQIKTYNPKHSCKNWHHRYKTITSSFIARRYLDTISSNRDLKVSKFRDTVSQKLKAHVSLPQARRAKRKAVALLDGDTKDQFAMLWDYIDEPERTNPGFKAGCRKIVGVDGCWLKGAMYGTQLLTAVGLDANNNIFPIAYAVVEKETRDTWLDVVRITLMLFWDGVPVTIAAIVLFGS